VLLAVVAACAVIGTEDVPAPGGVYREAVVGQPLSLNPLLHPFDPLTQDVGRLAYAGLVRVTDGGRIDGDLAADWTSSDDGRTYTFRLRPRATWHDGQPVTADDVLATVALLQSSSSGVPNELGALWRTIRADALDQRTVRFSLAEPYASFIEECTLPILPRHLFGADGNANLLEHPNSYAPVGAGPFKVQQVDADGITLIRHDAYVGPRPLLDEVQLRFYPDRAAALSALDQGEVDGAADSDAGSASTPERFALHRATIQGHQTLLLMNHRSAALVDPAVRRAVALAIQRPALVDGPMQGRAVAAFGPVAASSWAYSAQVEVPADPGQATQILEGSGWVGTPLRARAGRPLRLRLATSTETRQVAIGEAITAQLAPVGIRADVQPTQVQDLYRERLVPGDFDLAVLGIWLGTVDPDPYRLWHSSQQAGGLNFGGYANPRADELLSAARLDGEPSHRLAALTAFQQLWVEDVPAVVLFDPLLTYTLSTEFHGVRLGTLAEPADRFQHLAEWYLRTQRVPALPR
jgi:peptide/nickel transport system substrate-binding protein